MCICTCITHKRTHTNTCACAHTQTQPIDDVIASDAGTVDAKVRAHDPSLDSLLLLDQAVPKET